MFALSCYITTKSVETFPKILTRLNYGVDLFDIMEVRSYFGKQDFDGISKLMQTKDNGQSYTILYTSCLKMQVWDNFIIFYFGMTSPSTT